MTVLEFIKNSNAGTIAEGLVKIGNETDIFDIFLEKNESSGCPVITCEHLNKADGTCNLNRRRGLYYCEDCPHKAERCYCEKEREKQLIIDFLNIELGNPYIDRYFNSKET